ncbi:cytidine deaminase family protein [Micromonospora aurantiaca]|uniref:cytidine deaminase family protein n=1 Tax=Micromonospora TaxID=1873 RepID=UPI0033A642F3
MTAALPPLELTSFAWRARENARVLGKTMVGAAVLADNGIVYPGCNVEHKFRSHDVHAEVNALTSMITGGGIRAVAIAIASTREHFTPCGSCMDWIFELGGPQCRVYIANSEGRIAFEHLARTLMPFYPY